MDFFKAAFLGAFLTLVVSGIFGAARSTAGYLYVKGVTIEGFHFYWSWVGFFAATALAWALIAMTPK